MRGYEAVVTRDDETWLERTVERAVEGVAEGNGPFAAMVVQESDGRVLAVGCNRVTLDLDPSAHAEVVAIRRACREIRDFRLIGCVLYASCEPCPMCLGTALWARLSRVVFAANRHEATAAGFDDCAFHDLMRQPYEAWPLSVTRLPVPTRCRPFEAWRQTSGVVPY